MQASFLQIAQTRREAVAEERHEAKYMVGCPAGIGVMLFDRQTGGMVEQPVEDIGRLARGRRDHPARKRVILIRDVGVEADAGFVAVARVDVADRGPAPTGVKELAIARRRGAVAPQRGLAAGRDARRSVAPALRHRRSR
jgi:hypothetical protein